MIDAHTCDGDLALIRPQPTVDYGEIVVALIDGEATLKRFYRKFGHIRLQPEDSSMEPTYAMTTDGALYELVFNCTDQSLSIHMRENE